MTISYGTLSTPIGHVLIASSRQGIVAIRIGNHAELLEQMFLNQFKNQEVVMNPVGLRHIANAITEYVTGSRRSFHFPLDIKGSEFEMRVWNELAKIPFGETRSYTDIAIAIGNVKAVRAVANACGDNPVPIIIPCHRVIQKDGGLGGFSPGIEFKKKLLAIEQHPTSPLSPQLPGHGALH